MPTADGSSDPATKVASLVERVPIVAVAALTGLAVAALVIWQLATVGFDTAEFDYLFISGCLTTVGGLWLARGQAERFEEMFDRLVHRKALTGEGLATKKPSALLIEVQNRALRWSTWAGVVLGLLLAAAWVAVNLLREHEMRVFDEIAGPLAGAIGGFVVGRVLGRMLSYGLLGPFLEGKNVRFAPQARHVDGAGGLKPVGDYYLYQALLLALPAVFLLFWSFMLAIPEWDHRYEGWRACSRWRSCSSSSRSSRRCGTRMRR